MTMNLAPGIVLDSRYELLDLLGEGGMGQVFKARHSRLGKILAVKSLRHLSPDPAEQAKFLDAFESEARTLAELDHPALAKVSDFFEMGGVHFLVMEFIDGKTLSRVVELAPRNLSQRRVLQWARELCEVLTYLHTQVPPVIVRDLKPDNIMIDSKRRLRLIDFGISKRLKPGEGTRDIVKGMGTAEYAPLEQYGSSTTDQRSDIYALGATLYFLLTEIAPPPAWKRASEGVVPVPIRQVNTTVSEAFEDLIRSMMSLKREERPQSIEDVASILNSIPDKKPLGQTDPSSTPASPEPVQRQPKVVPAPPSPMPVEKGEWASIPVAPEPQPASVPSQKGEWAEVPAPPDYQSAPGGSSRSYGMPGSSLKRPKTVVNSPSSRKKRPSIVVVSCKSLRRYATTPHAVRACPGSPYVAVAGKYLQLWSLETEQVVKKLWSGEQQLMSVDFSADGRTLFAGEMEGKLRQFDVAKGKKKITIGRRSWGLFPDRIRDIRYLKGQNRVAVASDASNIRIFEPNGVISHVLEWHQTGLLSKMGKKSLCVADSGTGKLASGGADGSVTIYEDGDYEQVFHKVLGRGEILDIKFSPDGQFLAVAESRGTVFVLSCPDFKIVQKLVHPASPRCLAFSPDLRVLATGASDCQIRLFHLTTGKEVLKLSNHKGAVLDMDFSGVGKKLVSVGNDRRFYITELAW